jgi:hypothetical protein
MTDICVGAGAAESEQASSAARRIANAVDIPVRLDVSFRLDVLYRLELSFRLDVLYRLDISFRLDIPCEWLLDISSWTLLAATDAPGCNQRAARDPAPGSDLKPTAH